MQTLIILLNLKFKPNYISVSIIIDITVYGKIQVPNRNTEQGKLFLCDSFIIFLT
jgi:hypothetical protein